MDTKELDKFVEATETLSKTLKTIKETAKETETKWGSVDTEVSYLTAGIDRSYGDEPATIRILMMLYSHDSTGFTAEEKADNKRDNLRARRFVERLLGVLKSEARRSEESPRSLEIEVGPVRISISGYPTKVRYVCEKNCVALLPNGSKIALNKVPITA